MYAGSWERANGRKEGEVGEGGRRELDGGTLKSDARKRGQRREGAGSGLRDGGEGRKQGRKSRSKVKKKRSLYHLDQGVSSRSVSQRDQDGTGRYSRSHQGQAENPMSEPIHEFQITVSQATVQFESGRSRQGKKDR